jgi:hypothetical protein
MRQTIRANGHDINKCSTVSSESQKQHLVHPCQFHLARLSLVNTTLLFKNHIKILIFNGIFNFHKYVRKNLVWPFIKFKYIDLTVKARVDITFQINLSRLSDSWTIINLWHKCNQSFHLLSVNTLLKAIFRGVFANTRERMMQGIRSTHFQCHLWNLHLSSSASNGGHARERQFPKALMNHDES